MMDWRGAWETTIKIEGSRRRRESCQAETRIITPNYFHVMGIPLLKGRAFTQNDARPRTLVTVVNRTLARECWGDEDPVGERIHNGTVGYGDQFFEVVGVVDDVNLWRPGGDPEPTMYVPLNQSPRAHFAAVVRTAQSPMSVVKQVRQAVWDIDPNQPMALVRPMCHVIADKIANERFCLILVSVFAGSALILATSGISGLSAYTVNQRTHEIGIRMALGAQRGDVLRMMLKQGVILTAIGLVIGLAGAFALTRYISTMLYEVSPTDPVTFAAVALLLGAVALLASYIPARRATKVDPMTAIRCE